MIVNPQRLAQVDEDLCALVYDVASFMDVFVAQGARTVEDEQHDINTGKSHLKDPTHSYHVIVPGVRDKALAVDLARAPVVWTDLEAFKQFGSFVKLRAAELGIAPFSWGGDWPNPFDYDHFQKAPPPI